MQKRTNGGLFQYIRFRNSRLAEGPIYNFLKACNNAPRR